LTSLALASTLLLLARPMTARAVEQPADPAGSTLPAITIVAGQLTAGGLPFEVRGINYTRTTNSTAACDDLHFGAADGCPWDQAAIDADMARLQGLGVNTVRVFLNYYAFGGARAVSPAYQIGQPLANLDALINSASRRGIYILPVLLAKYPQDQFTAAGLAQAVDLSVRPVVAHLVGQTGVLGWDLFNEPDIGSPIDERCWDWDNADFPPCHDLALQRADFLAGLHRQIRQIDTAHLTTIGMGFAKSYLRPVDVGPRLAALVDFYSFHYYDNDPYASGRYAQHWYYGQGLPRDLERGIIEMALLATHRPVLISEIGFPTGPGALRTSAELRRDLALSLQTARAYHAAGLILWPFQPRPEDLLGDLFVGP
jgi:hypothetical protein